MKYHELETMPKQKKKRVGRGISAGQGKTAGRGTKGQNARTGKKLSATFMGGQGPLVRRIPKKRGFKSLRAPAQVVYLEDLALVKGTVADNQILFDAGLITTPYHAVKVISRGELAKALTVKVQGVSAGARIAIEKAGGTIEEVAVPLLPASQKKKKVQE